MEKRQYKDHILYEISKGDCISELGIKTSGRLENFFVPIRDIVKNGKKHIICSLENVMKISFEQIADVDQIKEIMSSFEEAVKECEESAFLDKTYIDISIDDIYWDRELEKYKFIMIPVNSGDYSEQTKKWELCAQKFTDSVNSRMNMSVEQEYSESSSEYLELTYNGVYGSFTLYIGKNGFVIGSAVDCDGSLHMNSTVSRHHCVFDKTEEGWTISDLGSSNGTSIQGKRLVPNQAVRIKDGDRICISDMEFAVRM